MCYFLWLPNAEKFSPSGGLAPLLLTGSVPWTLLGFARDSRYRLELAMSLYYPPSLPPKIQTIRALHKMTPLRVRPALRELQWLPLERRIQFKRCLLVNKTLIGHAQTYLAEWPAHVRRQRTQTTRSSNVNPWWPDRTAYSTQVRQQSVLCRRSSSMEQAPDRTQTVAIDNSF